METENSRKYKSDEDEENTYIRLELVKKFVTHLIKFPTSKYLDDDIDKIIIHLSPLPTYYIIDIIDLLKEVVSDNEDIEAYEVCHVILKLINTIEDTFF